MAVTPPAVKVGFRDIEFGFANARAEGMRAPGLLLDGFLDDKDITKDALAGDSFLFLGYKGSGKTALAERARLLGEREPTLFVTTADLAHFRPGDFSALAGGETELQARYPAAWEWVLLLFLVQSLERDEALDESAAPTYAETMAALRKRDMLLLPQLNDFVTRSSKRTVKASIPKFVEVTHERVREGHELRLGQMTRALRQAVLDVPATNRHVIFVDGLDEFPSGENAGLEALAALMTAADSLNEDLHGAGKPLKVVVLCRTDLFDRLPGANKAKIRRDSGRLLDWYDDPRDPDRTRLVRLVNLRAGRSLGRELNVFDEFLPKAVDGRPVRQFVLDHTRHLPRDMLQLMVSLQKFAPADGGALSVEQVKNGLREYSNEHFLSELRDELDGYLPDGPAIQRAVQLLSSLPAQQFTMDELRERARYPGFEGLDLDALVSALFDCSGIGTVDVSGGGPPVVTFKYRNRNAMLVPGLPMIVHLGALKALNIPMPARRSGGRRGRRRGPGPAAR